MVTSTMHHTDPDRSRLAVSTHAVTPHAGGTWRFGPFAPATVGTTGLFSDVCSTYVTGTNRTEWAMEQTIKRPARHLGTRST